MEQKIIDCLLRYRYLLAAVSIALTFVMANAARDLYLESDYKIYFEETDKHLVAHEDMEDIYTKSDNLSIMIKPGKGDVFTERNLKIIHEITERGWQTPFAIRVDSVTNFQHTAADGEDLHVADLLPDPQNITSAEIIRIRNISLSEVALVKRAISEDGKTTIVNVTLELPPAVDPNASKEEQAAQRTAKDASHLTVMKFGREMVADLQSRYPDLEIHLSGVSAITNSFAESSIKDSQSLIPLMYLVIIVGLAVFLRSVGSLIGTVLVIGCSTIAGVGSAAWLGYALNAVNITAPMIILTIAVCDAVHLLMIYLRGLSQQLPPMEAMRESLRLNLQPIVLTSVTTAVGFFTLNFSKSPPFVEFGNMSAFGVLWAMVLTFTLLPSITMLLVRKRKLAPKKEQLLDKYAHFVVNNRKAVFFSAMAAAAILIFFIPLNQVDDDAITYFKKGVPFRDASEFSIENNFGVNDLNYSIDCGAPSCVNDIKFLAKLEHFVEWLEAQPEVIHVGSYISVLKRLNRSMNRDEEAFYQLPENNDLSAQYNLMYEMTLPYGLDLNNQINIDKSSTRVSILSEQMTSGEVIQFEVDASNWLAENYPEIASPGSSVTLMFSHMGVKNIYAMILGGFFAIIGVTLTILIALRSVRYALISMIPNSIPAFMAFGIWGLMVGQVNMAVAAVFSISLGILVDDTVHFISKYRRGREVKGLTPEQSIHYAFANVGSALIVTTIVLVIGFSLLTLSDFNLNSMSGTLTAITISLALIFDFMVLPPILMFFDKDEAAPQHANI
jgi:predicted RND superfamily exporter protein